MAITIEQQPSGGVTAYNPIDYVLSSTNTAQTSFKYLAQLYINGVLQHTYPISPEPQTGNNYGRLDISTVSENFLGFDFDSQFEDDGIETNDNSIIEAQVVFGEQYDVSGVVTNFTGLASGVTIDVINASLNFQAFTSFDYQEYQIDNNSIDHKFLTNAPKTRRIDNNQNCWLYFYVDRDINIPDAARIETLDSLGAINGIFEIPNTFVAGGNIEDAHLRIPSGININNVPSGTVSVALGALPIIDSDVDSYNINIVDNTNIQSSEIRTFRRLDLCTKYEPRTIHFQNELGGFDSFYFSLVSVKTWDIERKKFKTEPYTLSNSGALTYSKSKHQIRDYYTKTNEKYVLNSDWINEIESLWLREMFDSPVVYVEIDGENIACNIEEVSYEEKIKANNKLFNITMTITLSFENFRQRW